MIMKKTNNTSSNHNENIALSDLSKLKYKPWKWIDNEWIMETVETSKEEDSNV